MKKIISLAAAALVLLTAAAIPAAAENQSGTAYRVTAGENFCTSGTFESVPLTDPGKLPQDGTYEELTGTLGWRTNKFDYPTVSIVNEGYQGGRCLKIAGNGENQYGAAYFIFPTGNIQRSETYQVSFMYKVTDNLTKTNQLHCDVMDGGWGDVHDIIAGLAPLPGEELEDGWRKVTGTFVVESPGSFKAIRFFADFAYSGSMLGADDYLLIDNVEVSKLSLTAGTTEAVNLSSTNLVKGGDFEYKEIDSLYDPAFDVNGWWTVDGDKMASTVVEDGGSKVLQMQGNMMLKYGSAYVNFQEKLQAGKTYRLMFDYKFLGTTREDSLQAHVAFMADADMQVGNPGGWSNVNLIKNDVGETLSNGYKRVIVEYTPTAFEAEAIYGLRLFINLAQQPAGFGIMFDNVRVSEVLGAASSEETQPPSGGGDDEPSDEPSTPGDESSDPDSSDVSGETTTDPTDTGDGTTGDETSTTGDGSETDSSVTDPANPVGGDDGESSSGGLPGWGIALIVVAVVIVLGGGGFCLWYFVIRPKMGGTTPPDGGETPPDDGASPSDNGTPPADAE